VAHQGEEIGGGAAWHDGTPVRVGWHQRLRELLRGEVELEGLHTRMNTA
jgi:hypothetical protein